METDLEEAGLVMNRFMAEFKRQWPLKMAYMGDRLRPVTMSVGVAHLVQGEKADKFQMRADLAMYEAKKAGGGPRRSGRGNNRRMSQQNSKGYSPLAARMRPRTLEEFVGQGHIAAPGRLLRRAISADQLSSIIFHGPPGTGKTTLAMVIANTTRSRFIPLKRCFVRREGPSRCHFQRTTAPGRK